MGIAGRLGILLLILGITAAPAGADTVQVSGGALTWDPTMLNPRLNLTGDRGLAIDVRIDHNSGTAWPISFCYSAPCLPGQTLSLVFYNLGDSGGVASIDGETFRVSAPSEDAGGLNILFDGNLLVPAFTGEPSASASAPFTFDGSLIFPWPSGSPFRPPVSLTGSGTATLQFARPHPDLPTGWQLQSLHYEFQPAAPVPEPTTLVLVGSGVAGLILRRQRTRPKPRATRS
jgi:hypothetical protein